MYEFCFVCSRFMAVMCYMCLLQCRCYCQLCWRFVVISRVVCFFLRCATLYFVNGVKKLSMCVAWLQFTNCTISLAIPSSIFPMFTLDSTPKTIHVDTTIMKRFGFIFICMFYDLAVLVVVDAVVLSLSFRTSQLSRSAYGYLFFQLLCLLC